MTAVIFIDETGSEDLKDPNNRTFGRGGCGILLSEYEVSFARPWKKLKRERLGGANRPFHAADFGQSRPSMHQIAGINSFMRRPFWRFAAICESNTMLPDEMDAHRATSILTIEYISRYLSTLSISDVRLYFEGSSRGDKLVQRDFSLEKHNFRNKDGRFIQVECYFMKKSSLEPGLEVADLIAHTVGRQRRHEINAKLGHLPDFQQTFWNCRIPPEFMAIRGITTLKSITDS